MDKAYQGRSLITILKPYQKPDLRRSLLQLLDTVIPFFGLWLLMLWSLSYSYLFTLLLAVPAAGLLVRLFIIQHDCGHGCFFRRRKANDTLGFFLGVLTLTPYLYWKRVHAAHHSSSGNLDCRTFGEIKTLTVREYVDRSPWGKLCYRLYRHPLVLFGLGPIFQFGLKHRLPIGLPWSWKKEWRGVLWTNIGILTTILIVGMTIGFKAFFLVHLPIMFLSSAMGVWLFYVQHQFEDTYWRRNEEWDFHEAGLQGSSYYSLPGILHWWTGNIGVHHVHHLSSHIPNYNLRRCFRENLELQKVTRLTLFESLKCIRLRLWDEEKRMLVGFRDLSTSGVRS